MTFVFHASTSLLKKYPVSPGRSLSVFKLSIYRFYKNFLNSLKCFVTFLNHLIFIHFSVPLGFHNMNCLDSKADAELLQREKCFQATQAYI